MRACLKGIREQSLLPIHGRDDGRDAISERRDRVDVVAPSGGHASKDSGHTGVDTSAAEVSEEEEVTLLGNKSIAWSDMRSFPINGCTRTIRLLLPST